MATTTKTCPYCGGELVGIGGGIKKLIPLATADDDYIWTCRGSCKLLIFSYPLDRIDEQLQRMAQEAKK